MNSQRLCNLLLGLIISALIYAFLVRGAYVRIYFIPLTFILIPAFALLLTALNHGELPFRPFTPIELPLLLFLGWAALSYFSSYNPEQTLFEVLRLTVLVGIFFIAAHGLDYRQKLILLIAITAIGAFEAILGLYQAGRTNALYSLPFLANPRPHQLSGTLLNKNHFAAMMEMSLFTALSLLFLTRRLLRNDGWKIAARAAISLAVILTALALVFSLSRAAWFSAGAAALPLLALNWRRGKLTLPIMLIVAVVILLTTAFLFRLDSSRLQKRVSTLEQISEGEDLSLTSRLALWRSAAAMTWDHPLFGTGWGAFREAYPSYRRGGVLRGASFAHNDYLQIASGTGIPGLIFFVLFIAMVIREGWRRSLRHRGLGPKVAPGIMAAITAVLIHETVDFSLMVPANAMVFFCLAGLVASFREESA